MSEEEKNIEKIANAIISYLTFKENFQKIKEDHQINIGKNEYDSSNCSYILREFNTDCYIIEKDHFKEFCYSVNFNNLTMNLDISDEKSKNNFIQELKSYLKKNPYVPNPSNIKIYSKLEEMKEIATDFKNYEFVNEDLLCHGMGVPRSNLKGKIFKVSKNKENTCLMSVDNDYTFIINNSDSDKENEEYKNLYYVDDLTKKIFILLFFNEQKIKKMLKKEIKNVYKFKKYYLINKEWLKEYKEFFVYDFVIKKYKEEYKKEYNYEDNNNEENDNDEIYSYDITNINLNDIVKNMGQINLYKSTEPSKDMRNAEKLIPGTLKIIVKDKVLNNQDLQQEIVDPELIETYIKIYREFDLINKDIFDLLEKEEFFYGMNKDIKNQIEFQALIGNNNIIIKNKPLDKDNERYNYLNEYLFYVDKNDKMKYLEDKDIEKNEEFILYYILNYTNNKSFFNDLKTIKKKNGLYEYIQDKKIIINDLRIEEDIKDKKGNFIGYFLNIRINEEGIKCENIDIERKQDKLDNKNLKKKEKNKNKILENIKEEKQIEFNKNNNKYIEKNKIKENNSKKIINVINFSFIKNTKVKEKQTIINNNVNENNDKKQNNIIINNIDNNIDYNNNSIQDNNIKNNSKDNNIIINNKIDNKEINIIKNDSINNKENNKIVEKHNNKNEIIDNEEKIINNNLNHYKNEEIKPIQEKKKVDYQKELFDYTKINLEDIKDSFLNIFKNIDNRSDMDRDIFLNKINLKDNPKAEYIILMNEENYNKFISLIGKTKEYYDLKGKQKEKDKFLNQNFGKIYNFCLFFNGTFNKDDISIIENYQSFENEKKNKKKFYIFPRENEIVKKLLNDKNKNIEDIYYYKKKQKSYILFCDKDKEFKIEKIIDNMWKLKDLSGKNQDIFEILKNQIKNNSISQNIEKYINPSLEYTEFYLINDILLDSKKKKNEINQDLINPHLKIEGFQEYDAPINFKFIEKEIIDEKYLELLIQLIEKNTGNREFAQLKSEKIFFVYGNNNLKSFYKAIYFGIISNNVIYFYLYGKPNYSVDLIIKYKDDKLLNEIKSIKIKGLEIYLFEMGIDLSKSQSQSDLKLQKLLNFDLEEICTVLNININIKNSIISCSKPLKKIEYSFFYNGVIQCLVNINQLKDLFLNRIKFKNTKITGTVSINFYKLMQYMWIFKDNKKNKDEILPIDNDVFLYVIFKLTKNDNNIFKDIKRLIEFILLSMHYENNLNNNIPNEQKMNYEINNLKKMSKEKNNSFIKKIFSFELEPEKKCCENIINNKTEYFLYLSSKELECFKKPAINIESILPLKKTHICKAYKKEKNITLKFKYLPEILIIIFSTELDYDIKFSYKEKITLKKISINNNDGNYELISFIIKNGNGFETYCKSSIEKNIWNIYYEKEKEQSMKTDNFKNFNKVSNQPYLLIYKKSEK